MMVGNLLMAKVIFLLTYFFIDSSHCLAAQSMHVHAGERQLIGNPITLSTLSNIRVGQHDIVHSRWFVDQNIDAVMSTLISQVPTDTIAWSDGLVLRMHWSSAKFSHVLELMPESDHQVSFSLSSLRSEPNHSSSATYNIASAQSSIHHYAAYPSLKKMLSEPELSSELLMDVRDQTEQAEALNLLYVSVRPIFKIEQILRRMLAIQGWTAIETAFPTQSLHAARSFEAMRSGAVLRIDLIEHMSRSFMHLNLSRGT